MERYLVNPVQVRMKESEKGSIYKSIIAMGYRARQINDYIKNELSIRMEDVITDNDETEGINYDQISISKEFDKYPKPTFLAMKELTQGELHYEIPEPESTTQ